MLLIIFGIFGVIVMVWAIRQYKRNQELNQRIKELESQNKSQQVKFGKSFEHFVPFTKDFPADKEKSVFLGMPIDFIAFEDDVVKFIEVKTGVSQLSNKQKKIKKLIQEKCVEWYELRY